MMGARGFDRSSEVKVAPQGAWTLSKLSKITIDETFVARAA
jgi:hypothetical protein